MFDVLVYLYENYWRPDGRLDQAQLMRKLSAVGFESEDIVDALSWLDGLNQVNSPETFIQSPTAHRVYSTHELDHLGTECVGYLKYLDHAGVLPPAIREIAIDRCLAAPAATIELDDLKVMLLMIFCSMGQEPDSLLLEELSTDPQDRVVH